MDHEASVSPNPLLRFGCALLGLSAICIAAICLYNNNFAFQREPVPASWPLRAVLIDLNIALLAASGVALLTARWLRYGAATLAVYLGLWALVLHLPKVFAGEIAAWLGAAECLAIAVAAARAVRWDWDRNVAARAIEASYAVCLFAFGAAHLIYLDITASMVPHWLPAHHFWVVLTGTAHISAGISVLTRVWTRWSTPLLSLMLASFTLLVNLPMAMAKGTLGPSAMDLCFAVALTASATIFAASNWKQAAR